MTILLVKGLLGMLGLYYNNNKSTKKGEESKQPAKPQSSFKLGDVTPNLISIILATTTLNK